MENKIYFGDNLQIMRDYILDGSVDLIHIISNDNFSNSVLW
jgi:DNA modification methylase